ncbi:MAG: UDP-N-acetylmuramoyl-L-alanyl-D-glutamate--2,6-diaminopimelate ligase [Agarilytica sp.]
MQEFNPAPKLLKSLLPAAVQGDFSEQLLINDIQIDSRNVTPGSLFVALKGQRDNGERYISSAVENGAVAVLVEDALLSSVFNLEIPIVGINDLKHRLGKVAADFFDRPSSSLSLVGITGTNGKSSIASYCAQLTQQLGQTSGIVGTLGYGLVNSRYESTGMTTPDVVSCQRILAELKSAGAKNVAMEVSSHGIDQNRVDEILFDVAVISNITRDHMDYHASFDDYAATKLSFLESTACKTAVINANDEHCAKAIAGIKKAKECVSYAVKNGSAQVKADVRGVVNKFSDSGMNATIESPWGKAHVYVPLVGAFNLDNLLAAISASCLQGNDFDSVIGNVENLRALEGRMEKVRIQNGSSSPSVFVDYAHTPDALENALCALKEHTDGNLLLVFGCGGDRDTGKREEMGRIAEKYADEVIVTSDNPRSEDPNKIIADIEKGLIENTKCHKISDRAEAIAMAVNGASSSDVVLIAGKGHEDYQIVGDKKIYFSDYMVAKNMLENRRGAEQVQA